MTAMPNDELSLKEIKRLIADAYRRIEVFEMTEESVVRPSSFKEEVLVDVIFMNVYRVLEEANSLSFDLKMRHRDIPWDQVRGMRNRLAHDYSHVNREVVWGTIRDNFPQLELLVEQELSRS